MKAIPTSSAPLPSDPDEDVISMLRKGSLLVAGAFAAWGLWLTEICWVKGWTGLAWLHGFNWSALPICALIMALCGLAVGGRGGWRNRLAYTGAGASAALLAFGVGRWTAFELFSGWAPAGLNLRTLGGMVVSVLLLPVSLPLITNRWLSPVSWRATVTVAVALALVLPLSFATIHFFPAFNGSTDQIHAIKMGYPVLWTALLLPLALGLGRKKPRADGQPAGR